MKNAIMLCSGGLDSVVTSYYVKKILNYLNILLIFFNYGQRNIRKERLFSKKCAEVLKANWKEIKLPWLNDISTSLLNTNKKVNTMPLKSLKDTRKESKIWYVPSRNLIFLSIALTHAESLAVKTNSKCDIFVGFKNEGKESFPDADQDFLNKFNKIAKKLTNGKCSVKAPFIQKDKEDIIKLGKKLGVNFKKTFSCYNSNDKHCGYCLSCRLRQEGFYWANIKDPTMYKVKMKDYR